MFTPTDCKDIRVRIFAFMAKTKFLYHLLALVSSVAPWKSYFNYNLIFNVLNFEYGYFLPLKFPNLYDMIVVTYHEFILILCFSLFSFPVFKPQILLLLYNTNTIKMYPPPLVPCVQVHTLCITNIDSNSIQLITYVLCFLNKNYSS